MKSGTIFLLLPNYIKYFTYLINSKKISWSDPHIPFIAQPPFSSQNLNIHNLNILLWPLLKNPHILNSMNDIHPSHCPSKDCMFLVQPRRLFCRNEELATVGVGACVRH